MAKRKRSTKDARRRKARRNPGELLRRAFELEQAGELDAAEAAFRKLISAHPRLADAWHIRASVARRRGDLAAAERFYRRATSLRDDARDHNGLGIVLAEGGDGAAAIEAFEAALRLTPGHAEATFNLASALEDAGRLEEAAARYEETIRLRPMLAPAHYNLGGVELRRGELERATAAFRRAVHLDESSTDARYNLGHTLRLDAERSGRAEPREEARACFETVIEAAPEHGASWLSLGLLHRRAGDREAALAAFERCLSIDPEHPTARHLAAALRGEDADRAPAGYVESLFDAYAGHFDDALVEGLAYTVPERVVALTGEGPLGAVLDLGCGTGLVGELLRGRASSLVGVDLSTKMLDVARRRGAYTELCHADAAGFLEGDARTWDRILAADVLVYLGALEALLRGVASRLAPAGRFIASVEAHDGEGYALRDSGRFAHAWAYVEVCAGEAGLIVDSEATVPLRKEGDTMLDGHLFVLSRPPPD